MTKTADGNYDYQLPADGGALRLWTAAGGEWWDGAWASGPRTWRSVYDEDSANPADSEMNFFVPSGIYGPDDLKKLLRYPVPTAARH